VRKLAIFAFGLWCGSWVATLLEFLANGYREGIFFTQAIFTSISVLILFYVNLKTDMSSITNLIWSFYHYVAWYGFRKGIILWMKEVKK